MQIDYDLHGIVGVRLVDPAREDIRAVSKSIGPPADRLDREPDLVIRFVDRVDSRGPLHRMGSGGAAFTDDAFVLVGRGQARPHALVPLAELGSERCQLVFERGRSGVPLLVPILNLSALGRGWIPVHASAFVFNGVGAIAAGWAGGGKTGTLLAFMAAGAAYVSDDWVYIGTDGSEMRGLPAPLEVRGEYLDQFPHLRMKLASGLDARQRARASGLRAARGVAGALRRAPGPASARRRQLQAAVARRSRASISPIALFGTDACSFTGRLDEVLLVLTHDAPDVRLVTADGADIARRLHFAVEHEWQQLLSYYVQFRFAFPDARNPLLEEREGLQRAGVARALSGKPAYVVSHPSPAPVRQLFDTLSPLFRR